jgi:hypothetical protein
MPEKLDVLEGRLIIDLDNKIFFLGTYYDTYSYSQSINNFASNGFFISCIENGKLKYFNKYPLTSLQSKQHFLSNSDMKRIVKEKDKKHSVNFSLNMLLHKNIIQNDSTLLLIAESLKPEYRTEIHTDARGYMNTQQVFDGYRYYDALAVKFDKNGHLIWDNHIEINDIVSMKIQENVLYFKSGKDQAMVYYTDGSISSKVFDSSNDKSQKTKDEIPTVYKNEKVIFEDSEKIFYWYDKYFLITSFQKVMELNGDKRKVYNFNKLVFE